MGSRWEAGGWFFSRRVEHCPGGIRWERRERPPGTGQRPGIGLWLPIPAVLQGGGLSEPCVCHRGDPGGAAAWGLADPEDRDSAGAGLELGPRRLCRPGEAVVGRAPGPMGAQHRVGARRQAEPGCSRGLHALPHGLRPIQVTPPGLS